MRVLTVGSMYPPHHLGGYELMWEAVVEALRSAGHDVRILASDHREEDVGPDESGAIRSLRWYWRDHRFPALSVVERIRLERQNLATLQRELDAFRPDVVSLWAMGGMSIAVVEKLLRGTTPVLGAVHDDWMLYGPRVDQWQQTFGRAGLAAVAERASGIPTRLELDARATWVFNSEATRDAAAARWDVGGEVVTPGVDLGLFRPGPDERPWQGRLLVLGRIDPRKGIGLAIEALAALPRCELRVIGTGDEAHLRELGELARSAEVADRVTFAAVPRERVPGEIASADAVLFPVQWAEPWGLVPLEAMATGTPVIASGRGGSAEFLRDGKNSIVYSPGDSASALAQAVESLSGDTSLRARLRGGGLATAARHSQERFSDRMVAIHEDLAA